MSLYEIFELYIRMVGYGVSIVGGDNSTGLYGNGESTFELAVIKGNQDHWELCYTTPITDDVIGWNSKQEITELMKQVQELPND